jgi:glycosyltransferase involved in cell wall biosynthesis
MSLPLVTCLCLTRNRREWLPRAIACFKAQTYANRELLIVADGEPVRDLIPAEYPRIRLLVCPEFLTVGEKRNLGCGFSLGEIVAVWDDDDFSAPARLAVQVDALESSGKAVTGYHTMKFTDGRNWWQYRGAPDFALGTSLCFRRAWWLTHRFQPIQCGQDELFSRIAGQERELVSQGDLDLMYATIHAGNTSARDLSKPMFQPLPGFTWKDAAAA